MKTTKILTGFMLLSAVATAQYKFSVSPDIVDDKAEKLGYPLTIYTWESFDFTPGKIIAVSGAIEKGFTHLGFILNSDDNSINEEVSFTYRLFDGRNWYPERTVSFEQFEEWQQFGRAGSYPVITEWVLPNYLFEVRFTIPERMQISSFSLFSTNMSPTGKSGGNNDTIQKTNLVTPAPLNDCGICVLKPDILPRADWFSYSGPGAYNLPADELSYPNGTNSKVLYPLINATHGFVHHGGSPNNYSSSNDSRKIIQGWWNYHVYGQGWKDLAYNYMIDQFGLIWIGRHNPWFPCGEPQGGATQGLNSWSWSACAVGNYNVMTVPTALYTNYLYMLSWLCQKYGINPTGQSVIGNTGSMEKHISGHKDAPYSSTSCPGTNLYAELPSLRIDVNNMINACINDTVPPTTQISAPANWQNNDFEVVFTDDDGINGSGLKDGFYTALERTASYGWRGNYINGFFNDDFSNANLYSGWGTGVGNWSVDTTTNELRQKDTVPGNTNIFTPLKQGLATYLYSWDMRISGPSGNRRAGIHIFASDTSSSRGDSYLILFNIDDDDIKIYRTDTSGNTLEQTFTKPMSANTTYNCKIVYYSNSGKMEIYMDTLIGSWQPTNPLTSGDYLSLRTGDCKAWFDNIRVYKKRDAEKTITVGTANNKNIRIENPSLTQPSCRIKSIVNDQAGNWSAEDVQDVDIDFTPPICTASVPAGWITGDFTSGFSDSDSLSGVPSAMRFYLAGEYRDNQWRANGNEGFFNDAFTDTVIHPDWYNYNGQGIWSIVNNALEQSNDTKNNSKIYAALTQNNKSFLYSLKMKINGTGNNRKGGFHFFALY